MDLMMFFIQLSVSNFLMDTHAMMENKSADLENFKKSISPICCGFTARMIISVLELVQGHIL